MKPITIIDVSQVEIDRLLADPIYNQFIPTGCSRCGQSKDFRRRIFQIFGVRKNKYADEDTQNMLSHYFLRQDNIEHVFFRTNSKNFYADSASCPICHSTAIVFGFSDDFMNVMMAKYNTQIGHLKK